ncbi:MAG: hypothetical protein HOV76_32580, partial [Hamadaea sp.]|nr:hypothetical protein [Hamadaea sp.]
MIKPSSARTHNAPSLGRYAYGYRDRDPIVLDRAGTAVFAWVMTSSQETPLGRRRFIGTAALVGTGAALAGAA